MNWLGLIAATIAMVGCSRADTERSQALQHYLAGQADYIAGIMKIPELAAELSAAKATVAGMSDDQIRRVESLGYPVLIAADEQQSMLRYFPSQGVDWTRFVAPHGGFRTADEAAHWNVELKRRLCAETVFLTVEGRIGREGRRVQDARQFAIGIIPFGAFNYLGTLVARSGEHLSITWSADWMEKPPPKPLAADPLDDREHRFELSRMRDGRHWIVRSWSGSELKQALQADKGRM